eukprot:TRINITY_DN3810_c0_g3_i1.p1 TRINITY_DN3810_c0_g3~~TRINITY_DN3810_c0_g3_i1.p1  ORF type:complete len:624 (+),score=118.20 TRINITY_DN3810_c0_g3_i1:62-1873(+)
MPTIDPIASMPSSPFMRPLPSLPPPTENNSCLKAFQAQAHPSTYLEVKEKLEEDITQIMKKLSQEMRQDVREELRDFFQTDVRHISKSSTNSTPRTPRTPRTLQLQEQTGAALSKKRVSIHAGRIGQLLGHKPVRKSSKPTDSPELDVVSGKSHANLQKGSEVALLSPHARKSSRMSGRVSRRATLEVIADDEDSDENSALVPGEPNNSLGLQEYCEHLVTSRLMQTSVIALVLLNSISMGVQTEYQFQHMDGKMPAIFRNTDIAFCLLFSIELVLRVFAYGFSFFTTHDWAWNVFDSFINGLAAADLIYTMSGSQDGESSKSGIGGQFSIFRMLRVLRVVRAIRIVRVLRFVEELRTISVCIMGSMRSLCWTLLLLFMLIYIAGICITQIILDHSMDTGPTEISDELLHWFGGLSRTWLTLYQSITAGVNWDDPMTALTGDMSMGVAVFVLIFFIAFTIFAMLNVVTGVFVEQYMVFAQGDKQEFMMNRICDIFKESLHLDNGTIGRISWIAFEKSLETEEMQDYFKSIDLDLSQAKGLFELLDADGNGTLDAVEFVVGCVRLTGQAKALDMALLMNETLAMRTLIVSELKQIRELFDDFHL